MQTMLPLWIDDPDAVLFATITHVAASTPEVYAENRSGHDPTFDNSRAWPHVMTAWFLTQKPLPESDAEFDVKFSPLRVTVGSELGDGSSTRIDPFRQLPPTALDAPIVVCELVRV
jgi:hypothetical protein